MKILRKIFAAALMVAMFVVLSSCRDSNDDAQADATPTEIPFRGTYSWKFTIPNIAEQVSKFTFYSDHIDYKMDGGAYVTNYQQMFVSFDKAEQRLITVGKGGSIPKDGVYFVMFFKDVSESRMTIYKHECKSLDEAKTFPLPAATTEADHGWNVYNRE